VCGKHEVRRAVEAWRLELELDATVAEQLEPVVTDRGPRATAKELLESVACARRHAHGRMQVEAIEVRVMTKRFVVPPSAWIATHGRRRARGARAERTAANDRACVHGGRHARTCSKVGAASGKNARRPSGDRRNTPSRACV